MRALRSILVVFVLLGLIACSDGEQAKIKAQVEGVEAELLKLETPVAEAHEKYQAATAQLPTDSNEALAKHLAVEVKPLVHDAAEKSLAADNRCYDIQKRVENSSLPQDVKSRLAGVVFQHSRFYYCRWRAYEAAEEAIDLLGQGKGAEYKKAMAQALENMNEGTAFQVAAISQTLELNSLLGISPDQK